jgi:hypothetical protein
VLVDNADHHPSQKGWLPAWSRRGSPRRSPKKKTLASKNALRPVQTSRIGTSSRRCRAGPRRPRALSSPAPP